ncbi:MULTISPECIES: histone-like nucleoid-structuring protein Lsr2 [Streptomyces]|uniref:Lsr2 family protein n=2 Tax=Streptomyces TaxID=1883 RepID=A0ABV9IS80_9ACTN
MAQKVQVLLIDDLSGGEADENVTFGLDGKTYEIDLSHANADELRKLLEPYVTKGRKTAGGPGRKPGHVSTRATGSGTGSASAGGGQNTAQIRAWAKENGFEVNDRGRVPEHIREAYAKATA